MNPYAPTASSDEDPNENLKNWDTLRNVFLLLLFMMAPGLVLAIAAAM